MKPVSVIAPLHKILCKTRRLLNRIKLKITKKPAISIIIPIYNCQDYLEECLDTVTNQTLKNIEILCIDDESTDDSLKILKKYAKKDKRFKILKQKHSNAGNARNLGIENSQGEYLLFLDSDDIFSKNICKYSYNKGISEKADVVLFKSKKLDNKTKETTTMPGMLRKELLPNKEVFSPAEVNDHIFQITPSAPWSKLFKTSFIKKNKLYFQSCPNSNDVFFTRTAMVTAKRITTLDRILINYRTNHGTNTQATKYKNPLAFYEAYLEVQKFLKQKGIYELYEKSFKNVVLLESYSNYNTTNSEEGKKAIIDKLKKEGLKELDLLKIKKENIYNYDKYSKLMDLIKGKQKKRLIAFLMFKKRLYLY